MKKFILMLSVIFSLSILGACGHSEADYEAVYNKIEEGKELNVEDYDLMLDYIDDVVAQIGKAKSMSDLQKLDDKYKYAEPFMHELKYGHPSEEVKEKMTKKAEKVYENFQKVQEEVQERLSNSDE